MNRIYNVVWSTACQSMVMVSELTGSRGKRERGPRSITGRLGLVSLSGLLFAGPAIAEYTAGGGTATDGCTTFFSYNTPNNRYYDPSASDASRYGNTVDAACAIAIGNNAQANGQGSIALGDQSQAAIGGVALGSLAQSKASSAVALGPTALASGFNSFAAMRQAGASGDFSMAIGTASSSNSRGSIALGYSSTASADYAISIGSSETSQDAGYDSVTNTAASGVSSVAIGRGVKSSGTRSVALGADAAASNFETLALGSGAKASGLNGSAAIGNAATADGRGSIAVGTSGSSGTTTVASGADSLAIGNGAKSPDQAGAAVGFNANAEGVSSLAVGADANAIGAGTVSLGRDAATSYDNSVALGAGSQTGSSAPTGSAYSTGTEAPASEVSIGSSSSQRRLTNLAAGSAGTDAVNVNQLNSVAQDTATALGGGSGFDSKSGEFTAPSYSVGGQDFDSVGGAIARQDTISRSMGSDIADVLGGGATYSPENGAISAPQYSLGDGNGSTTEVASIGDAVNNLDDRTRTNTAGISANADEITNLSDAVNSGTVGLVQQSAPGEAITVAAGTDGTSVDLTNNADESRRLTGVSDGDLAADSSDAVNGSQLLATNQNVTTAQMTADNASASAQRANQGVADTATALGGGASYDPATGDFTAPSYTVSDGQGGTTEVASIGDAVNNLDDRTRTNTAGISANADEITNLSDAVNSGTVGLVQQSAPGEAITVAAGTDGTSVDLTNNADESRRLTGVSDGDLAADSSDAVNGSQLWAIQNQITGVQEGNTKYSKITPGMNGAHSSVATGKGSMALGSGSRATGERSVAQGQGASVTSDGGIALGSNSEATRAGMNGGKEAFSGQTVASNQGALSVGSEGGERQIANVAGGTQATDAVNVRQLGAVQAGSVNYDHNEDGSVNYSSVTLGQKGTPAQVHNVAAGEAETDAANVGQLRALDQNFREQLGGLYNKIVDVEDQANAGTASALAAASVPQATLPGKSMVAAGAGTYSGESAVSVGISRLADNGRWTTKFNFTGDTQSNFGAGIGVGFQW
ncbi:YadA-like family protein [Chromohalobacter israelensis]|uniref:YadA-like family protein n=1 Tax=Chromohalobacter israelensis TaxID=141390 RepID=UPI00265BD1C9|nr:YadA-like family protein [Chromohalobacter salexigens]MDO0944948.1 YadA-like family protein [Chromohalobacter salexigens]